MIRFLPDDCTITWFASQFPQELRVGQRCRAETLGGIAQRLFEQHCIMSAGFERGDGLVVVGLPIIEHVLHGEEATWLLRRAGLCPQLVVPLPNREGT